jgi:opacity protein-like surface antigen
MKKVLFGLILLVAVVAMFAQNPVVQGQSQFNAGFGFSNWGVPIYLGLDYGVSPDFTLGGEFSYNAYHEDYRDHYYDHSIIGISGNANFHFNRVLQIPDNWDFYAGLNLGFYIWDSPDNYNGSHTSGLGLGGQVGTRLYITDNVGVNLEFGGGNAFSGGKLGISIKM